MKQEQAELPVNLVSYLESESFPDSLDYAGLHGYLTGCVTCLEAVDLNAVLEAALDHEPVYESHEQEEAVTSEISALYKSIQNRIFLNEDIHLPCTWHEDEALDGSGIESWASGFMEAALSEEESLLKGDDDEIDYILPLLVVSGLFDEEEKELAELRANHQFLVEAINDIPELLVDLYLYLRRE